MKRLCCAISKTVFAAMMAMTAFSLAAHAQTWPVNYNVIGYSPDGRYFAFEEFGRVDDSPAVFATLFVRDIVSDHWVLGTPARRQSFDPDLSLGEIRAQTRAETAAILSDLKINHPATLIAANGDGALDTDMKSIRFGIMVGDLSGRVTGDFSLRLEQFDTSSLSVCGTVMDGRPQGFALLLDNFGRELPLHRDGPLTRSRGCPFDYEIKAVFAPLGAADISRAVALIAARIHTEDGVTRTYFPVALGIGLGRLN